MPDIAMCRNSACPLNTDCWRYTAAPNPDWQGYADWQFQRRGDQVICAGYWQNNRKLNRTGEGDA